MSAPTGDATAAVQALRSTTAIRERAAALLARARAGESTHFTVDDAALASAARTVAELTRQRFPDLRIPYHSRWRHFEAGQVNRVARLDALLGPVNAAERARTQIDLALVSVLLDAGAGADWGYREADSQQSFSRSEGLGVASFHAFTAGLFSSDPAQPLRVDAAGLAALTAERLGEAFQVSTRNPLVGLEGRSAVLRRLGLAMLENAGTYGPAHQSVDKVTAADMGALMMTNAIAPVLIVGSQSAPFCLAFSASQVLTTSTSRLSRSPKFCSNQGSRFVRTTLSMGSAKPSCIQRAASSTFMPIMPSASKSRLTSGKVSLGTRLLKCSLSMLE